MTRQSGRVAQQVPITATNIIPTISDKPTDLILARIAVPVRLSTSKREQNLGKLAITRASLPPVKRPEHQDMPVPRLLREIMRPLALWSADQRAP